MHEATEANLTNERQQVSFACEVLLNRIYRILSNPRRTSRWTTCWCTSSWSGWSWRSSRAPTWRPGRRATTKPPSTRRRSCTASKAYDVRSRGMTRCSRRRIGWWWSRGQGSREWFESPCCCCWLVWDSGAIVRLLAGMRLLDC